MELSPLNWNVLIEVPLNERNFIMTKRQ